MWHVEAAAVYSEDREDQLAVQLLLFDGGKQKRVANVTENLPAVVRTRLCGTLKQQLYILRIERASWPCSFFCSMVVSKRE